MVNTRRAGATAPAASDTASQAQRGTRRGKATGPSEPVITKRRTRSARTDDDSPLQALTTPPRRTKKAEKVVKRPVGPFQPNLTREELTHHVLHPELPRRPGSSSEDNDEDGYAFNPPRRKGIISILEGDRPCLPVVARSNSNTVSLIVNPPAPKPNPPAPSSKLKTFTLADLVAETDVALRGTGHQPKTPKQPTISLQLNDPMMPRSPAPSEQEARELRRENRSLLGQVAWMEAHLKTAWDLLGSSSGQDETDTWYPEPNSNEWWGPTSAQPSPIPKKRESLQGSAEGIALLRFVEAAAEESQKRYERRRELPNLREHTPTEPDGEVQPTHVAPADIPATPHQPSPKSEGLLSRMWSTLKNPFASFTSSSNTPPQQNEVTVALTPVPTPVGESRSKSKRKRVKNKRQVAIKKVVANVVQGVKESERADAEAWAESVLAKLPKNSDILSGKRKRLDLGMITVGELRNIPADKPWRAGGRFGIDEDIDMLDDEDPAPAWAVLQDLLLTEENDRPAKKLKQSHEVDNDEIPSINESSLLAASTSSSGTPMNSHGKSSSLLDVQPRSSRSPSAMFGGPVTHQQGNNVFNELHEQYLTQQQPRATTSETLKASTSFGTFSYPEPSDDDLVDDDTITASGTSLWTQQPPPAPIPAHASLPTPAAVFQPIDEVERARAKALKHTPAKPSRLREIHVPSPSLKSDAGDLTSGDVTMLTASPLPVTDEVETIFMEMPDVIPLELPTNFGPASTQDKTDLTGMTWGSPVLSLSDPDDE